MYPTLCFPIFHPTFSKLKNEGSQHCIPGCFSLLRFYSGFLVSTNASSCSTTSTMLLSTTPTSSSMRWLR
uniref:Uncharacterized protein n=1 Tax=Ditylenchus dipsaci TaxID=166011 RepID=A0A915EP28_9BILA